MSEETSRKFLSAAFRPIEPARHGKDNAPLRRPQLDSPVNSIFPDVPPLDQRLGSANRSLAVREGSPSRNVIDRLDGSDHGGLRHDGPGHVPLSGPLDEPRSAGEERYLELLRLREKLRQAEENNAVNVASKRTLAGGVHRVGGDKFLAGSGREDLTRIERRDTGRGWEPLESGDPIDHNRRISPASPSFVDDRLLERRNHWRALDDNTSTNRQPGPPSVRSNVRIRKELSLLLISVIMFNQYF